MIGILDRKHKHVYPGGRERVHNYSNANIGDVFVISVEGGLVLAGYGIYSATKWGIATVTAPATGGVSYVLAGAMP